MLAYDIDIPIAHEKYCTLQQACEYIMYGWEPVNDSACEKILNRHRPALDDYNPDLDDALARLTFLFDRGLITLTGIADPAFPVYWYDGYEPEKVAAEIHKRYNYDPQTYTARSTVVKPEKWHFDLESNWVVNAIKGEMSYRDILIPFDELKSVLKSRRPQRYYRVDLNDDGYLTCTDGALTYKIAKLRTSDKKFQWLKYYIDNPNHVVTKEELANHFNGTKFEFQDGDNIADPVYNAFTHNAEMLHACFPVLGAKEIMFKPDFTDLNLQK